MNKRINFEDSVFIILMRIKLVKDIIILDGDPEIFLEKLLDDIYFTDRCLGILLENIMANEKLISRDEYIGQLLDAERQFSGLLDNFLSHKGDISINENPAICNKLLSLQKSGEERQNTISIMKNGGKSETNIPVVSQDELNELLKDL